MQFCLKCKSIMFPENGIFKCKKCGYKCSINDNDNLVFKSNIHEKEVPILEGDFQEVLPTTDIICPECNNNKAYCWLRQLRSADEPETRFFKCTKCSYTWREYD